MNDNILYTYKPLALYQVSLYFIIIIILVPNQARRFCNVMWCGIGHRFKRSYGFASSRMLCVCHGVLYKQLSAWMLHGLLQEDSDEFFIARRQKKKVRICSRPSWERWKCLVMMRKEVALFFFTVQKEGASRWEEDKVEVEEGEEERGVAGTKSSESGEGDDGGWEYVVHHAMAPSYFSVRILEKVRGHLCPLDRLIWPFVTLVGGLWAVCVCVCLYYRFYLLVKR